MFSVGCVTGRTENDLEMQIEIRCEIFACLARKLGLYPITSRKPVEDFKRGVI